MSEPYLGEIRMFAGDYAPVGWALCNGQLLNIADYDALNALLGTTYGGDGQTTFAVPDLQGRVPIHPGSYYPLGGKGGTETVTLVSNQLPSHTHVPYASTSAGTLNSPSGAVWAEINTATYSNSGTVVPMNPQGITATGGGGPHDNMMPTLTVSFIIALQGIYPTQN